MFGMGIGEIFLIIIIAILFLGPDKLPSTMVEIAKFFRSVKSTVNSARATLEEEMKFSEMKEEALNYKKELTDASAELERITNVTEIGSELNVLKNEINLDVPPPAPSAPKAPEVVTFAPKPKETKPVEENA
ncbi:twin-arginine translocation protein, TatB subunit [Sulfuricurvum kujiense DSM 16994]|uniref:Sec-independent protein translocase protein TatB homolog n=1 Tax=Sulfuricurvum kujiense (strain ATCC BAA-921 / DSM 16994 / JCM 11577 / YK-1) TaxID=709032 RepID=E4U0G8_SULKY|nr:Sec-independent protein translocase protein TatB [Sulfuricurvum kujiense]ADR33265.1 twin-arginine translocation protein, TatB subunit [Sulfuricurvum kujiense DSM 16994]